MPSIVPTLDLPSRPNKPFRPNRAARYRILPSRPEDVPPSTESDPAELVARVCAAVAQCLFLPTPREEREAKLKRPDDGMLFGHHRLAFLIIGSARAEDRRGRRETAVAGI